METCIFCDGPAVTMIAFPDGKKRPSCTEHVWKNEPVISKPMEKRQGFHLSSVVEDRQTRRDFSNRFYCGH